MAFKAFEVTCDVGDAVTEGEIGPAAHESANLSDVLLAGEELEEFPANEAGGPGDEDGSGRHDVFRVRPWEGSARG